MENCNTNSIKEELSSHVENIFKTYSAPGLHICDIATGGGKSYTIGKLTCEYYPNDFERIIILCVQKKLVEGMDREIEKFINTDKSLISGKDKLVIENNPEVISKAVKEGYFKLLLDEMEHRTDEQKDKGYKEKELKHAYNKVKKCYEGVTGLISTYESSKNEYIQSQINEGESNLRKLVRSYFDIFTKHLERTGQHKKVKLDYVLHNFPSLEKVYPQVNYKNKKVLLMTVHKAMYGIDPILSEKIYLQDFGETKKTLILFDESDQAAIAMRNTIIDQAIENGGGSKRFAKGYNGYLQYKTLIESDEHVSDQYYGDALESCLKTAQVKVNKNWNRLFEDIAPYKNILLDEIDDIETFRRGVFFSGPAMKLNIGQTDDKTNSYICHKKGDKHLSLVHSEDVISLKQRFNTVVSLDEFLSLIGGNLTIIKSQFRNVIIDALAKSREKFKKEEKDIASNTAGKNQFLGYPTLEREVYTLLSRFETPSEYQFGQQLTEFITNRKNLFVKDGDKTLKLPDSSVYSQGVQLYQEEVDERDNQHRVRLSCREITTTPEKILFDLANSENTSIVLCSATASSSSVVSNFDMEYLKFNLDKKVHTLSEEERIRFDDLVEKTYPNEHKVEVVQIAKHEYIDERENEITFPEKYKALFCQDAIDEGLADEWFRCTKRELIRNKKKDEKITYQLYRLFQFIETYRWFVDHKDVHSMIFFQNRTGDKDKNQFNTISCLVDGTYKQQPSILDGEIPRDWNNANLRMSKEWEDVEKNILSELSENKDAKLMLITAYNSFKAGANMQYGIPEGLDYLIGDNWESSEGLKKDWDAIYLQTPTAYLMMNEDGTETSFEKSLYNAMLTLMMLYARSCLSKSDVAIWLGKALTNSFWFSEKNNPGCTTDKAAWAQTIVEQAVGRLCRTRNKPHITYILYDESMTPYFEESNMHKSLTKEFRTLARFVIEHPLLSENSVANDPKEIMRCNDANYAKGQLDRMRSIALRYTPHAKEVEDYDIDELEGDQVPHFVKIHQVMNQSYKNTIIKKPVINGIEELEEVDRRLTFINRCYGTWERNDHNEYFFSFDPKHHNRVCQNGKGQAYPYPISPATVRLDILMKNPVIKKYFEEKGYATDWKKDGLILHPEILSTDYAGEIGEEAFKAIVLHYTTCDEESFVHLEGKNYELADFIIRKKDGSNKIAFDVKNMNPYIRHDDKPGDLATTKKRQEKKERLGCELITVNMLKIEGMAMDEIREIHGVIDEKGNVLPTAIQRIKDLIED